MENVAVPGSTDLLTPDSPDVDGESFGGVRRVTTDGTLVWSVGPPSFVPDDAWTRCAISDGKLVLNSWSCHRVEFDLDTGRQESATFTK